MVVFFPPLVLLPMLLPAPSVQPSSHPAIRLPSPNGSPLCFAHTQARSHKQVPGVGGAVQGDPPGPWTSFHSRHEPLLNPSLDTRNGGQGRGCAEPVIFLDGMLVRWESPDSDTSLLPDLGQISIPSRVLFSQAGNTHTLPEC